MAPLSVQVFTGIAAKLAYNVDTQKLKRAPSFDSNANRNISAAMAGKTVPTILLPMYTSVPQRRHLPVVNPGWVESVQAGCEHFCRAPSTLPGAQCCDCLHVVS